MIRNTLLAALAAPLLALAVPQPAAAADYQIDATHTSASFKVKHMMVSWVRGDFDGGVQGTIAFDPADVEAFAADVAIDVATIDTREDKRDAHLKSADFFDVENHPQMTFKSTEVRNVTDGSFQLAGDLTIRGKTLPVVIDVEGPIGPFQHPMGGTVYGFHGTTTVDRTAFGLEWNVPVDGGGWLVGKEVQIDLDLELIAK